MTGGNFRAHDPDDGQARLVQLLDGTMKQRWEYNPDGSLLYEGVAEDPTATNAEAKWRIKKYTTSNGQPTASNFADSTNSFTKVWDDRATFTYS